MSTKKFKCKVCGYIHEGNTPPETCPQCNAKSTEFELVETKKKGFNTNSNAYTIIYASVVVIIVAFLLAFVSQILKEPSAANERIDKKKQILSSLNFRNLDNNNVEAKYSELIVNDEITNLKADIVNKGEDKDQSGFKVSIKDINDNNLPIYICNVNGETKYVVPLVGKGLWGTIWGYVALNDDLSTIYGAYFSHESETAGLGARITEPEWQDLFKGKQISKDDFQSISLSITKNGKAKDASCEIDGITGATLTSNGVNNMLKESLLKYKAFFAKNKK